MTKEELQRTLDINKRMMEMDKRQQEYKARAVKLREMFPVNQKFEAVVIVDCIYGLHRGEVYRCSLEQGTVFVYGKGRRNYGKRFSDVEFCTYFKPKPFKKVDENEQWHKDLLRVVKRLEKSGLWPEICEVMQNLIKVDYTVYKQLYAVYWNINATWTEETRGYVEQYPFFKGESRNGLNGSYFSEMFYKLKTKSMYFGDYNSKCKEEIARALAAHQSYNTGRIMCSYDVSFEYDAAKNKAWYSEEYKGCGNGHYYIALDASMALFCEDD